MSFVGELGRRNVVKVAVAYAIVGWLLVQIADTFFPALQLPEWTVTFVAGLVILGFPLALVLSWAYELTPNGMERAKSVPLSDSIAKVTGRKLDFVIIGVLAIAVAVFTVDRFVLDTADPLAEADIDEPESGEGRSIAVLPFADMSPGGDQEYFGDGIAEELLNALMQLEGLQVAGRTSSFSFKNSDEDLQTIGEALGVTTILDGSVRKDGERVRITAQLINAADGYQLWSEIYDRELTDIFAIQEDIASSAAGALGIRLGVGSVNAFKGAGTTNVEAYEAYLEGLALGPTADAIPVFERATELDANYAVAWAQLGLRTSATQFLAAPEEAPAIRQRALGYVQRAVDLDPESAQAVSLLGTLLYANREWIEGEQAHLAALSILKDRGFFIQYGNLLTRSGRSSAAMEQFDAARELDALNRPGINTWAAYLALGRQEEARESVEFYRGEDTPVGRLSVALNAGDQVEIRSLLAAMPPARLPTTELYAPVLRELDAPERALGILRSVHEDESTLWPSKGHDIAMLAAYFGDPELALDAFGDELRYTGVRSVGLWYPHMSEVRQLPRFKELMTELNLVEFWRASGWADACQPLGESEFTCR